MKNHERIPNATIKRLFRYYRAILESRKTDVISSDELAKLIGSTAAQIRKDFAYFGEFGKPGRGYDVQQLGRELKRILGIDREWDVALIGVGNLGRALSTYPGLKLQGFKISVLFDKDPRKIGQTYEGLPIQDIRNITGPLVTATGAPIKIAIMTVPAEPAQEVVNLLVQAGIKAILNFAPTMVAVPADVKVLNIDMANELSRLSYHLTPHSNLKGTQNDFNEAKEV